MQLYKSGFFAVVETDFKVKVSFDWNSVVMVTVPNTYAGALCGLCGNFNDDGKDDMLLKVVAHTRTDTHGFRCLF